MHIHIYVEPRCLDPTSMLINKALAKAIAKLRLAGLSASWTFVGHLWDKCHCLNFILNIVTVTYEPCHEKTSLPTQVKTKTQISFAVTAKLISTFVFATRIVQSPYFLNSKFQASSHLQWLYSPVYVGPGWKPRRPVFSQRGSYERCQEKPSLPTQADLLSLME